MAVSDNSGYRQRTNRWIRLVGQLSRYDLVLAAIPLVFVLAAVVSVSVAVSLHTSVGVAALLSAVLVTDALYLHPPTRSGGETNQSPHQTSRTTVKPSRSDD
jgi:hypothetical protein